MDEPFRHTRTVSKAHTHTQIHKHTNTHKHTHTGGDSNLEFPNGQAFQTNEHTAKLFPQQLEHTKLALSTVHSGFYIEKQRCSILGRVGLLWAGWLRMVPPHPSYWIVPPPNHPPTHLQASKYEGTTEPNIERLRAKFCQLQNYVSNISLLQFHEYCTENVNVQN